MAAARDTIAWRIGLALGFALLAAGLGCAIAGYLTRQPGIEGLVTRWWATPAASLLLATALFLLCATMVARPGSGLPVARVLAGAAAAGLVAGIAIAGAFEWQQGTYFEPDLLAGDGALTGGAAGVVVATAFAMRRRFGLAAGAIAVGIALGASGALLVNRHVARKAPYELDLTVTRMAEIRGGANASGLTEVSLVDAIGRPYRLRLACLCGRSLPPVSRHRFIVVRGILGYDFFVAIGKLPEPPPRLPSA